MALVPTPEDVRRFILTSITSVPFLEAMLLLRNEPESPWDARRVAERLYTSEKAAAELLSELCAAGFLVATAPESPFYSFHPNSDELGAMVDRVAEEYTKNLVEVTNLIHSKTGRMAQYFSDAFKLRRDS